MSKKILRCYNCYVTEDNIRCSKEKVRDVLEYVLEKSNLITELDNKNKFIEYKDDKSNKFSLEIIEEVNGKKVNDNYLLFRVGKKKDMQDMVKRNRTTLLGEGVLDKDEQRIYELEVCTYFLVDLTNAIIIEMFGQYAPGIKIIFEIIRNIISEISELKDNKINITYENIMTDKMIESYKRNADKLQRFGYSFAIPSAEIFAELGLDIQQIELIKEMEGLRLDLVVQGKPRIPITKNRDKIKAIIEAFSNCKNEIKEKLFFEGNVTHGNLERYTFEEVAVTYSINIEYSKKEDGMSITLDLNEIEEQVYDKILRTYLSKLNDLKRFIED